MNIPLIGKSSDKILQTLQAYKQHDLAWRDGRVLAYVYDAGRDTEEIVKQAFTLYLSENALDPTTFPSTLQMEREIVRMTANLLRGDEQVVGNVSSGGTESIMLAVKTARDWGRATKGINEPEMILASTAHAAFHKAAHYLGVKLVIVPFNPHTFQADVDAMQAAVAENTILLVASAPCYSHGTVDPVPEIGALAQENNILCHVDACIGGFQLSFMRQLGYDVPAFDFTVPGVTSISIDVHKYGYAAKGASVILYKSKELRRHQIFACLSTTAYAIINPTVLSTKSGGPLAGAWAVLNYLGTEGYQRIVREVTEATRKMIAGINALPDLHVLGRPTMCIFALESDTVNVFQLADVMRGKGWYLQPQFSADPLHPNIHITVNQATVPHVDDFLRDLAAGVEETKGLEGLDTAVIKTQIDALLSSLPPDEMAASLYELAGIRGSKLPEDTAFINTVLNVLPKPLAEHLLLEYFNDLYV
ncbi:MAG: aspartate aminotransferase family protein [Chloroflexi bacterium]|nr:aspartate aminotransferase family protein [Chloroflexota bacterium]